jgi:thiol-disulfide isomerase/thioredoxin/YHS domain-containing protein
MRIVRSLFTAIVALASMVSVAGAEDQMPWQPNLETAQQIAARSNRLVLIHFWAPWCQPCMRLEKEVFSRNETARALESNFVLVKLNTDEAPGTTRMYGVSSLPADVIVAPNGRLVSQFQSPPGANQYVAQLNQAAAGHRELLRKSSEQVSAAAPQGAVGAAAPINTATSVNTAPLMNMVPPAAAPYDAARMAQSYAPVTDPAARPPAAPTGAPNDRYAEYFHQPPAAAAGVPAPQPQQPAGVQAPAAAQASPNATASNTQSVYNAPASYSNQMQLPQLPPGCPPIALDGNCPVTLVERMQWVVGDKAWGAIHRGRTYLFAGPQEREKFMTNPDLYSPVMSGIDPVLALDNQVVVSGRREFGVFGADRRIYLFADEASLKRFEQNPKRYAAEAIQARR